MIYYYDNRAGDELVIEDTSREIDRLCDMVDIAIQESFEDTILGKIIGLIGDLIKWIFNKIKEIFDKISEAISSRSFERKAASIDPQTLSRETKKFPYYDTALIESDFNKKYDMLKKAVTYYKSKFVPLINAYDDKKLKALSMEIDLNDYVIDYGDKSGFSKDFPNPHFDEMRNKIENKEEPYYKTKTFDYYQMQKIHKDAKEHPGKTTWEYLGIKHIDLKFEEKTTKELDSLKNEMKKYSEKLESNKEKAKDDDSKKTYNNLVKITEKILKYMKDALTVISKKLIKKYNTLVEINSFFNVTQEPKDESAEYIREMKKYLKDKYENFGYLTEAYIGKTKTLLEIEEQIGVVRERALKKFTDINKSPEVLKLNRMFEKQFGMECFALYIAQEHQYNAGTMPIQRRFDIAFEKNISKYVEGDAINGFRFKEGNGFCVNVYLFYGVLEDEIFTNAEILAIILHEIGHNFADAVYDDIKYANINVMYTELILIIYMTIINFIIFIATAGAYSDMNSIIYMNTLNNEYQKRKGKSKHKSILRGLFTGLFGIRNDLCSFISEIIVRIIYSKTYENYKLIVNKDKQREYIKKNIGRQNEVIADKFAGIYGYGPEQVSALMKLESHKSDAELFMEKIPFLDKINNKYKILTLDINDYDVHPHDIQRAHEEIKLLKREINKADCDPKMKKVMQDQIDEIEDIINQSIKVRKNCTNYEKQKAAYYKLINNKYPDAITDELEEAIEKALDNALKGGKK